MIEVEIMQGRDDEKESMECIKEKRGDGRAGVRKCKSADSLMDPGTMLNWSVLTLPGLSLTLTLVCPVLLN